MNGERVKVDDNPVKVDDNPTLMMGRSKEIEEKGKCDSLKMTHTRLIETLTFFNITARRSSMFAIMIADAESSIFRHSLIRLS